MSTRASIAADLDACPAWHLYRDMGEPGDPLVLTVRAYGMAVRFVVPQQLIDALQGARAVEGER